MRRLATFAMLAAGCLALPVTAGAVREPGPAAARQSGVGSWAEPQIRAVVGRGLMGGLLGTFRPDDALTRGELSELAAGLSRGALASAPGPPGTALQPVSIAGLDARLVGALGLTGTAKRFAESARSAGLDVPARFGTEVVARLLGLRVNHFAAHDDLELLPDDPVTRAEAAYSAPASSSSPPVMSVQSRTRNSCSPGSTSGNAACSPSPPR